MPPANPGSRGERNERLAVVSLFNKFRPVRIKILGIVPIFRGMVEADDRNDDDLPLAQFFFPKIHVLDEAPGNKGYRWKIP